MPPRTRQEAGGLPDPAPRLSLIVAQVIYHILDRPSVRHRFESDSNTRSPRDQGSATIRAFRTLPSAAPLPGSADFCGSDTIRYSIARCARQQRPLGSSVQPRKSAGGDTPWRLRFAGRAGTRRNHGNETAKSWHRNNGGESDAARAIFTIGALLKAWHRFIRHLQHAGTPTGRRSASLLFYRPPALSAW